MIHRSYTKNKKSCRVTFRIHGEDIGAAAVLGDFNRWDPEAHRLQRRKDGTFSATVSLPAGERYRFRYLVDGRRWLDDEQADGLIPNRFGTTDGLLEL